MKLIAQRPHIAGVVDSYSEATFEDIVQAHPKCGTCRWALSFDGGVKYCDNSDSNSYAEPVSVTADYCRYHEPKEENP